jgi:hypothetical protein
MCAPAGRTNSNNVLSSRPHRAWLRWNSSALHTAAVAEQERLATAAQGGRPDAREVMRALGGARNFHAVYGPVAMGR